jgi:hypothetical protein
VPSAKRATWPPGAVCATAGSDSVTMMLRPIERRLMRDRTAQVEDHAGAVGALPPRSCCAARPRLISWLERPRPLTVLGKSKAMRAGLATAKLGGTVRSGSLVVMRTMILASLLRDVERLDAVRCAAASREPQRKSEQDERAGARRECFVVFIFVLHQLQRARALHPLAAASCTSSFSLIAPSSMPVMTPKFCPM